MKTTLTAALALSLGLGAATAALPETAAAQSGNGSGRPVAAAPAGAPAKAAAAASNPDMRLWSFGECDRNFPYHDSPEHKECVRVVGSDEAKDARAFYFCDTSHAKDPTEAKRCKEAYVENKSRATTEGFRANPSAQAPAPGPAAAPAKRDQAEAIASLTRALKQSDAEESAANAAAAAPAPEPAPAPAVNTVPPDDNSTASNIMLGLAILLLLTGIGMRYLRRMTDSPAADARKRRGGSNSPRTVMGGNPRTVTGSSPRTVSGQAPKHSGSSTTRIISVGPAVGGLPPRQQY